MAYPLFRLSILSPAVTINRRCKTSKRGEVSLRNRPQYSHYPLALNTSPLFWLIPLWWTPPRACARVIIVKGVAADSASLAHKHTRTSRNVASDKKKKRTSLKLSLFMRLQCNTLSLTAQGRKLAKCAKQIRIAYHLLFLPGLLLPHFFSFLSRSFVFQLFVLLLGLFTELDCHSNHSNCRPVQRSPVMLNGYLCRHLCIYSMSLTVYYCILCALVCLCFSWLSS